MNVLVLKPLSRRLEYTCYVTSQRAPVARGTIDDYAGAARDREELAGRLRQVRNACQAADAGGPDAIAIRSTFGGPEFSGPALVGPEVIEKLRKLAPQAPLHVPALLSLLDACAATFGGVPTVLLFETAFFADLPGRERTYALDAKLAQDMGLRRYGFHGLLHQAACAETAARCRQRKEGGLAAAAQGKSELLRVLSVCLDGRPEVAAVLGGRAVMVTGGTTPLEGLPGQTSCGEIDPSIVLILAQELKCGPEQVNDLLTRQSGLAGLVGPGATLADVFGWESGVPQSGGRKPLSLEGRGRLAAGEPGEGGGWGQGQGLSQWPPEALRLAREIMQYRILLACGMGLAALGGLDAIVFSGRYAHVGATLGPYLAKRLTFRRNDGQQSPPIQVEVFDEPLERIVADAAAAAVRAASAVTTS